MRQGLDGFESFAIEDDETWRLQACVSPVWDTCLTLNALHEAGVDRDDPMLVKAADWLVVRQIRTPGDWSVQVPDQEPGGWAFEFHNETYPDTDDAAEILIAIHQAGTNLGAERDDAIDRGMRWLLSMQSKNGGWGSFDKDNTSTLATKLPFFDFGETIDPPTVDVTAHILEAIGLLGLAHGLRRGQIRGRLHMVRAGGRRSLVRSMGSQLPLRDRRRSARTGSDRPGHDRSQGPAGRGLDRVPAEHGRGLGRDLRVLRRPGTEGHRRKHRVTNGLGDDGSDGRGQALGAGGRKGRTLPGLHTMRGRYVG